MGAWDLNDFGKSMKLTLCEWMILQQLASCNFKDFHSTSFQVSEWQAKWVLYSHWRGGFQREYLHFRKACILTACVHLLNSVKNHMSSRTQASQLSSFPANRLSSWMSGIVHEGSSSSSIFSLLSASPLSTMPSLFPKAVILSTVARQLMFRRAVIFYSF